MEIKVRSPASHPEKPSLLNQLRAKSWPPDHQVCNPGSPIQQLCDHDKLLNFPVAQFPHL